KPTRTGMRPARPPRGKGAGGGRACRGGRHVARILRGEIRWAQLDPTRGHEQSGRRPVLILSHDVFNERSGTVIAVALTSQTPRAGFPLIVEIAATGLPRRSW